MVFVALEASPINPTHSTTIRQAFREDFRRRKRPKVGVLSYPTEGRLVVLETQSRASTTARFGIPASEDHMMAACIVGTHETA